LKILDQYHLGETAIEAEAVKIGFADLERLDKMITIRELRRHKLLQAIAEYRTDLALRARAGSDRAIKGKALTLEHTKDKEAPATGSNNGNGA
jgi:hypothetical protein